MDQVAHDENALFYDSQQDTVSSLFHSRMVNGATESEKGRQVSVHDETLIDETGVLHTTAHDGSIQHARRRPQPLNISKTRRSSDGHSTVSTSNDKLTTGTTAAHSVANMGLALYENAVHALTTTSFTGLDEELMSSPRILRERRIMEYNVSEPDKSINDSISPVSNSKHINESKYRLSPPSLIPVMMQPSCVAKDELLASDLMNRHDMMADHDNDTPHRDASQDTLLSPPCLSSPHLIDHNRVHASWTDYDVYAANPTTNCINQYCVHARHMPSWYNDNAFIYLGYRRITNSYAGCLKSLFYLHNETGNVYTHLIGVVLFFVVVVIGIVNGINVSSWNQITENDLHKSDGLEPNVLIPHTVDLLLGTSRPSQQWLWKDAMVFGVFYAGAITCLALSTIYHLCCCHSRLVLVMWNKADYIGIVALIVGSFVPTIFYAFYCYPFWQILYLSIFTLMGFGTIFVSLMKQFSSPKYRFFRTSIFAVLGVSGAFPLLHAASMHGARTLYHTVSFDYIITMGGMYLLGAFIYAYRIPERWFKNMFDIWGHSHQIWHCLVLGAAWIHYCAVVRMFEWRSLHDPSCAHVSL
ncbi:hypothetical protein QVD99_006879 [Batrachochytrium dendrobatidis]|nr:hypothetical protein O5D80_007887 [Batrachochytrium dendrobatidis]KAK5666101.1 hypothetical protein QVD99_006879 [Batrachochytrium dendrobatidis]